MNSLNCVICGSHQVGADEVEELNGNGVLGLAECRRCEHRWLLAPVVEPLRTAPQRQLEMRPTHTGDPAWIHEVASAA